MLLLVSLRMRVKAQRMNILCSGRKQVSLMREAVVWPYRLAAAHRTFSDSGAGAGGGKLSWAQPGRLRLPVNVGRPQQQQSRHPEMLAQKALGRLNSQKGIRCVRGREREPCDTFGFSGCIWYACAY